jgi:hypothetical protein
MAAVMLSEAQFAAMMAQFTTIRGNSGVTRKKRLDQKYMRVKEFEGNMTEWSDWAFAFRRTVRGADRVCYDLMEEVEKEKVEIKEEDLNDAEAEDGDASELSAELYDLLCTTVKGEALTIMKTVEEFCGFKAWQRLYAKYNPKTTARAIKLLAEVCSPGAAKSFHEVETSINNWKNKLKLLEKEFDEKVGERMKIAILTSMLPTSIQDHVFQTVCDSTTFDGLVAKVNAWVSNKVAMEGTPMDIGQIDDEERWWAEEWDVDAVGAWTQCHGCRGYGHISRDCPYRKGKGKGNDKGYGKGGGYFKGGGKSNDKGYGKGGGYFKGKGYDYSKGGGKSNDKGNGKGKGYQGTCWTCGTVGHKSAECRKWVNEVAGDETEGNGQEKPVEEVSVGGGVWIVGAVDVGQEFVRPRSRATCTPRRWSPPPGLEVRNAFQGLRNDDDHDDYEEGGVETTNPKQIGGKGGAVQLRLEPRPSTRKNGVTAKPVKANSGECLKTLEDHMRDLHDKIGTAKRWSNGDSECEKTPKNHDDSADMQRGAFPGACRECFVVGRNSCVRSCVGSSVGVDAVECPIGAVEAGGRRASMRFHVASVQRPLASAVRVVQAGNRVIMSQKGAYIENETSGERMPLRIERGTFVFDVEYGDGSPGTITLDSGAGVNVWPEHLLPAIPMQPPERGLRMTAANGTEIPSRGVKTVEFKSRGVAPSSGGSWHA